MWQSRIEIEYHYVTYFLSASLSLMRYSVEILLRVWLMYVHFMNLLDIHVLR